MAWDRFNPPEIIKFEITASDIACGIGCDPLSCPAAMALSRTLDMTWGAVGVLGYTIRITGTYYRSPKALQEFISDFDSDTRRPCCEPGKFELYRMSLQ